jgi:hypothetical protein
MRTCRRLEPARERDRQGGTLDRMQIGLIHIEIVKARKRP